MFHKDCKERLKIILQTCYQDLLIVLYKPVQHSVAIFVSFPRQVCIAF